MATASQCKRLKYGSVTSYRLFRHAGLRGQFQVSSFIEKGCAQLVFIAGLDIKMVCIIILVS